MFAPVRRRVLTKFSVECRGANANNPFCDSGADLGDGEWFFICSYFFFFILGRVVD